MVNPYAGVSLSLCLVSVTGGSGSDTLTGGAHGITACQDTNRGRKYLHFQQCRFYHFIVYFTMRNVLVRARSGPLLELYKPRHMHTCAGPQGWLTQMSV